MISYEYYKILHLLFLIVVTACLGIGYFCNPPKKWARNLGMTASFLLMVAGMGLLARLYPGQPWPVWAKIKLGIWLVVAVSGPMLAKRLTNYKGQAFSGLMVLLFIAICLAILKPYSM